MLVWERLLRRLPPWRRFFAHSLIALVVGMLVVLLLGLGRDDFYSVEIFFTGAVVGLFVNAGAVLALAVVYTLLPELRYRPIGVRLAVDNVAHFAGGAIGFVIGNRVAARLGAEAFRFDDGTALGAMAFGLLAIAIGLLSALVGSLRRQVERGVARSKEQEFALRQLDLARSLQRRLLAPESVEGDGYRVESRNLAALAVAGDFYDVFHLGDGDVGLVVGDVAGRGVAAALVVASVKAMTPLIAAERTVPETLDELNRRLLHDLRDREFVALAFARYKPSTGRLEIGNAGLPDPYRLSRRGVEALEVSGPRLPLGLRHPVEYRSLEVDLKPGESVLMMSDGIPASVLPDGSPLGYEWLLERLESTPWVSDPAARVDELLGGLSVEVGERPEDDWTLLLLERGSRAASRSRARDRDHEVAAPRTARQEKAPAQETGQRRRRGAKRKSGRRQRKKPVKTT